MPDLATTPADWDAIVDDAVHEINQRWGESLTDDEWVPFDPVLVRETAEAVVRRLATDRDTFRQALTYVAEHHLHKPECVCDAARSVITSALELTK